MVVVVVGIVAVAGIAGMVVDTVVAIADTVVVVGIVHLVDHPVLVAFRRATEHFLQ